ncbi:MAG: Lrp/AsnC family transcriptional regulator [Sphaerochaetaceae bacterium]|jgi:Lrp/AsnC family transcriptional regulator for asnA, asnC and gidA|nr:Lrp/AsnC family transcriptional regulator [Sphaerochaetaceae bacterium]MDX9808626.1 Lrp/AsnC family transcriptional regulator [Sphaerochaetaceae bacterium]NLV84031.1 Lrp/AsnC family transcriptional regulator [Spirochaetales bacterium]
MKKIDETNKAIIKQLYDGRKAYSAIADELKITENTVRARVNKLIEEGILQISGLVDPESIPGLQVVMMGVKLKTLDLERKAKEFSLLRGVISAAVVTGRYDLIVQLVLSEAEGFSLLDFFKKELVKVTKILEVETFVVYQSHNFRIPYIL